MILWSFYKLKAKEDFYENSGSLDEGISSWCSMNVSQSWQVRNQQDISHHNSHAVQKYCAGEQYLSPH